MAAGAVGVTSRCMLDSVDLHPATCLREHHPLHDGLLRHHLHLRVAIQLLQGDAAAARGRGRWRRAGSSERTRAHPVAAPSFSRKLFTTITAPKRPPPPLAPHLRQLVQLLRHCKRDGHSAHRHGAGLARPGGGLCTRLHGGLLWQMDSGLLQEGMQRRRRQWRGVGAAGNTGRRRQRQRWRGKRRAPAGSSTW